MLQPTAQESQVVVVQVSGLATHLFGCSMSAAVGQTSMQAPEKSQLLSWMGAARAEGDAACPSRGR